MAKNSVQDWDGEVASNNSDVGGINIAENCPPSNINDAIREIMRQVRNWQSGGDSSDWNIIKERIGDCVYFMMISIFRFFKKM